MDLFNETDQGMSTPGMIPGQGSVNYAGYRFRVAYFQIGGENTQDSQSALETLLTRGIPGHPDAVVIVDRTTSISATTGMYTCVINYLEKEPDA